MAPWSPASEYTVATNNGPVQVEGWPVECIHELAITTDPDGFQWLRVTHIRSGFAVSLPWAGSVEALDAVVYEAWCASGRKRSRSEDPRQLRRQYAGLRRALDELGGSWVRAEEAA